MCQGFKRCGWFLLILAGLFASPLPIAAQKENPPQGLSLSDAVDRVLQRSPMSAVADNGLTAAEQGKRSARGEFLPKLKTQFDYSVSEYMPEIEFSTPAGTQKFPAGSDQTYASETTLEQPLFTGLALLSQYRLAELHREGATVERRMIRQGLILQSYEAYYGILVAEKFLGVAEKTVTQLESHAEVARQFFENGMIPKNDLLKSLVTLAEAKQNRIEASHDLDLAWSRLRMLLRMGLEEGRIRLTEDLSRRPYEPSLEDCIELALRHRPEILKSQLDVEKGTRSVNLARSGYFPTISLVGSLLHDDGGFAESDHTLTATLHADWTIWEWGSNYYTVKQRKSQVRMAQAQHNQTVDRTKLEVRAAYLELDEWRESIGVAETSIEQAEENYRITVEQYNENITTSTEVLDAQTLQARAQVNYYNALSNYNLAIARLEKAMGILEPPSQEREGGN